MEDKNAAQVNLPNVTFLSPSAISTSFIIGTLQFSIMANLSQVNAGTITYSFVVSSAGYSFTGSGPQSVSLENPVAVNINGQVFSGASTPFLAVEIVISTSVADGQVTATATVGLANASTAFFYSGQVLCYPYGA